VEPVANDYFLAPFLITLPHSGSYSLHTSASLLDQQVWTHLSSISGNVIVVLVCVQGVEWAAGPQAKMSVVVDSEQNLKGQERQGDKGSELAGTSRSSSH
jgi:hypothetical protein